MDVEIKKDVSNAPEDTVSNSAQSKENQNIPKTLDVDGESMPINHKSFEKVVGQYKKAKATKAEMQDQIDSYQKKEREREEHQLAEKGEYSKLLELKEKEILELNGKLTTTSEEKDNAHRTLVDAQKMDAVFNKLPGRLKNNKYMSFVDIDNVVINPDTGDIDEKSAAAVANQFMESHSELVDTSHVGGFYGKSSAPNTSPSSTYKDLPLKEMRLNIAAAVRAAKQEKGIS